MADEGQAVESIVWTLQVVNKSWRKYFYENILEANKFLNIFMMLAAAGQFRRYVQVVNIIVKFPGWTVPSENVFFPGKTSIVPGDFIGRWEVADGAIGGFCVDTTLVSRFNVYGRGRSVKWSTCAASRCFNLLFSAQRPNGGKEESRSRSNRMKSGRFGPALDARENIPASGRSVIYSCTSSSSCSMQKQNGTAHRGHILRPRTATLLQLPKKVRIHRKTPLAQHSSG